MKDKLKSLSVPVDISVKEAMRQMSVAGEKTLFVVDQKNKLIGTLTDGDIRRWVLKEGSLLSAIKHVYNQQPIVLSEDYDKETVKQIMISNRIEGLPIVRKNGQIKEILLWSDVFGGNGRLPKTKIDVPVVIMAGGKGTRLDPFTRILPKPLIPIGEKAIIEIILDKFCEYGVEEFYISVNHKSRMIKAYFEESNLPYKVKFIDEDKPLGTAGALKYLEGNIKDNLLVSNCDILIDGNYAEFLEFHKTKDYDITIIGSFRHFTVPYGICTITNGGTLSDIREKPEYDFLVNTGMYLLKKHVLACIPKDEFYNLTDLIKDVKEKGGSVGVFPIDEKSWIDIGQWEEFHKSIRELKIE